MSLSKYLKYKSKYLELKNQLKCLDSVKIGNQEYNINEKYYIASALGKNPKKYPTLSSFKDAEIETRTGLSLKYPKYHFNFELFESNSFDSGLADIYSLTITKTI
jgi:hypothetical protein